LGKTVELAIGAALLSHVLLALLWLGWAVSWLVVPLTLAVLLRLLTRAARFRVAIADAVFLPYILLYLVFALAPPTAPDAIGYHLGLASEWLRSGSLARSAVGYYDVIPHGLETLFMAAAAIGGLSAASLVHFAFLLATLPLIAGVATRLGFDGRPAALLYFASPVAGMAGTSAYVDAALAFYALATLWLLLENKLTWAGLTAGFCYAIKMSGGVITLAAGVYLLARRSWSGLALAAAMVVPWLFYAWWLSGNPVAPMLPTLFPSPAFYPADVADWIEYVRSYGVPWRERWWEVTLGGARAQGLLGPGFLLAPLALLALRQRKHAALVLAAAVCGSGWFLNAGTRFLIPAAVFVALALASVLPPRAAWGLAIAQAVLCWPAVLDRYAPANAWRLPSAWPWRAALRLEPEAEYLRRLAPETLISNMVDRHAKAGERVLDFGEAPRAYAHGAELLAGWQYTPARRAMTALLAAHSTLSRPLYTLRGQWPRRKLRSIRFEQRTDGTAAWSIQEIRMWRGLERLFPSRAWELEASSNPWEAALAFDRNSASAWRSWEPRGAGMHLEIFGNIETDAVELVCRRDEGGAVRVTGVDEEGRVLELAARLAERESPVAPNLRFDAVRYLRREGFRWILAHRTSPEMRGLGRALVDGAAEWNLEKVDEAGAVYLLGVP
jgi:hypothetical protein